MIVTQDGNVLVASAGFFGVANPTIGSGTGVVTSKGGSSILATAPGAYPYQMLDSDGWITVDCSAARTILLKDDTTKAEVIIADGTAQAGTNNITVGVANAAKKLNGTVNGTVTINVNGAFKGFWRDTNGQWYGGV
jgi:hypothetical protein